MCASAPLATVGGIELTRGSSAPPVDKSSPDQLVLEKRLLSKVSGLWYIIEGLVPYTNQICYYTIKLIFLISKLHCTTWRETERGAHSSESGLISLLCNHNLWLVSLIDCVMSPSSSAKQLNRLDDSILCSLSIKLCH